MKERKLYTLDTEVVDLIAEAAKIEGRTNSNLIETTMKRECKKIIKRGKP